MKQYYSGTTPLQQLLLLVILTLLSWLLISILGMVAAIPFWGSEALSNPAGLLANQGFLKFFQVIQSIGLFILPPLLFLILTSGSILNKQHGHKQLMIPYLIIAAAIVIVAQPLITFLGVFNNGIDFPESLANLEGWMREKELLAQNATEIFLSTTHWSHYILNVFIIAILPAIGEELMFRGALQKIFHAAFKNTHVAVFITAALFSAIHIQFFGFLPRLVLGIIFGYLMVFSHNIWLPIMAHFTNNFMAFIMYQAYAHDNTDGINPLDAGQEYPDAIWVTVSAIGIILLLWLCKRIKQATYH